MALSNQSDLPVFFSPRQVNLKISHRITTDPTIPEMTCRDWPNPRRWLTENGQIPEKTYPKWTNPER
jgi:hypothetical protein